MPEYAMIAALVGLIALAMASGVGKRLSVLMYNTAANLLFTPTKDGPPQ